MGILGNLLVDPVGLHYKRSHDRIDGELTGVSRQRKFLEFGQRLAHLVQGHVSRSS